MIDVEVKGCLGQYIKAVLKNITDTDAVVSYDSRDGEEHVPLSNVRLPPSSAKDCLLSTRTSGNKRFFPSQRVFGLFRVRFENYSGVGVMPFGYV
ncbi:hypothetical protein P879_10106 [Paragonimus westermani]|uniref:Agenet-like domain-containing protein n=1 Tax=Paragonimus westermani TaxID=34504 RepID=A0A8T0DDF3_9TREM|nr:hypothetical protein P879_10106 [Paragonimus westermani]